MSRTAVQLLPLQPQWLDAVQALEAQAHSHPWGVQQFADALQAGYHVQTLWDAQSIIGYWIGMPGVEEVHLLNITVAPAQQGQGYARCMLDALVAWARSVGAQWVWLEVRVGNTRALQLYQRYGFETVGRRKDYYPAADGAREDAWVMNLAL